ncbi:MAG TPA: VOC family protein [Candidatus Limiplasma sp.]|nr:VOC family protein [Candidatus Limiplasma sp.]HRX08651.1 VOC family protein [Candidatus Limiplasma sp.]
MKFAGVCLIAENTKSLYPFYQTLLGEDGHWEGDEHVDFQAAGLCIFSVQGMESMAPGSMAGRGSGKTVLSFDVENVDGLSEILLPLGATIVKPPQDHPWGLRSVWLKDPEGNILSIRCPVR